MSRAAIAAMAGRRRRVQPEGDWPVLRRGANPIRFRAEGPLVNEVRVQIAYG